MHNACEITRRTRRGALRDSCEVVEFATAADGVSIGFERFGQGPPVVRACGGGETLRMFAEDATPVFTSLIASLSGSCSLVCFDRRGTGWSDRTALDASMRAAEADLAAVVQAVADGPIAVYGAFEQAAVAVSFAAHHPELVARLVLQNPIVDGLAHLANPMMRCCTAILPESWEFYVRFVVRAANSMGGQTARHYESLFLEELSQDYLIEYFKALEDLNIGDVVSQVDVPALVVQQTNWRSAEITAPDARWLGARLPQATLLQADNGEEIGDAIASFVNPSGLPAEQTGFRAIMFTDLVSSTAMTQQLGDEGAQRVVMAHDRVVQDAIDDHGGTRIKHTGDGIMAGFASAVEATRAARRVAVALADDSINVRVGLNAGEPISQDGDLFGAAVQLASRVCDRAEAGQVLATGVIRELTAGKDLSWHAVGEFEPKGFNRSVAIHSLNLR